VVLTEGVEAVLASRQELVGIGLMAHIPDDAVDEEVELVHEGHRQFHGAHVGTEVPARLADGIDEEVPDLSRELLQLSGREVPDLLGCRERIQERGEGCVRHQFPRWARNRAQAWREAGFGRDCSRARAPSVVSCKAWREASSPRSTG